VYPDQLAEAARNFLLTNILGEPPCFFFKKEVVEETGAFNTTLVQLVDYEFILRLGMLKGMAFVPKPLVHFRVHGKSQTSQNSKEGEASLLKRLSVSVGDVMVLFYGYLTNPAFSLIKDFAGVDFLNNYIRYIYYTDANHQGEKIVNKAIQHVRDQYKDLVFNYSFFKYIYYRHWFKSWQRSAQKHVRF
jgi:hypothetical protein